MNYKLKHLAKYCCRPANELEFEAVKMAAEIGGVDWYSGTNYGRTVYAWSSIMEQAIILPDEVVDDESLFQYLSDAGFK